MIVKGAADIFLCDWIKLVYFEEEKCDLTNIFLKLFTSFNCMLSASTVIEHSSSCKCYQLVWISVKTLVIYSKTYMQ